MEKYIIWDLKEKYLKNYKFISNTDTEVLLNLYSEIGIENLIKIKWYVCIFNYDTKKIKFFKSR